MLINETNTALRVLLKQREENIERQQEKMAGNVKRLVSPHLSSLKHTRLNGRQATLIHVIHAALMKSIIIGFTIHQGV